LDKVPATREVEQGYERLSWSLTEAEL